MHHYTQGKPTRQAHKAIPEGFYEEEQGLKGFFGAVSHLIRKRPSTRWVDIDGHLKPRMYDLVTLKDCQFKKLLYNTDVGIYFHKLPVCSKQNKTSFRNADGDLIYFCHQGKGQVFTEYGVLDYKKGHYIVIPKCISHSIVCAEQSEFLVIENKTSHFEEPDRGVLGKNGLYDTNALTKPDLERQNGLINNVAQEFLSIQVKHNDQVTKFTYDECVYDVVGWKGDLYPFTLHVDHIMPIMSHRAHLPPSAHSTFVARNFVVCTFLPRPLESDSDALKVPFYHQNIDYDEVLFYHDGDFFSRDNLHSGMLSFHPAGFPHGPHPKAVKGVSKKTHTNEYAVMIDTRNPLTVSESISGVELKNYWESWKV